MSLIDANALKTNDSQRAAINKEISGILGYIDEKVRAYHNEGIKVVPITLPTIFSLPNMSNKDAQRCVYYGVLQKLLDKHFNVEIDLKDKETIYTLTWLSDDERAEIDMQNAILAKYSKKK